MQESLKTLTIKQASRVLGLTSHTLRFWEKVLDGVLVPLRTEGGQRRYTKAHLSILEDIKKLKNRGLSLIEIKDILNRRHDQDSFKPHSQQVEILANELAEIVKSAVYRILRDEGL